MKRPKLILVTIAVLLSIASIILTILNAVSIETTTVLLGVGLLVISAAIIQK